MLPICFSEEKSVISQQRRLKKKKLCIFNLVLKRNVFVSFKFSTTFYDVKKKDLIKVACGYALLAP